MYRARQRKVIRDVQTENAHGEYNTQHLLDLLIGIEQGSFVANRNLNLQQTQTPSETLLTFAATVMVNAEVFLFAVNETILRKNAITPLNTSAQKTEAVIFVSVYSRTWNMNCNDVACDETQRAM